VPTAAQTIVLEAKRMLAVRLAVPVDEIRIVSVEPRDWPDASLGCPQPGRAYAQVITPGYRVVLEFQGTSYPYHTSMASAVACDEPDMQGRA
jgi:hypothetical protein